MYLIHPPPPNGLTAQVGQSLLILEVSRSHSVRRLSTSDGPVAEIFTWQHSHETDIHASGGIRTRNPSKTAALDRSATENGVGLTYNTENQNCRMVLAQSQTPIWKYRYVVWKKSN